MLVAFTEWGVYKKEFNKQALVATVINSLEMTFEITLDGYVVGLYSL